MPDLLDLKEENRPTMRPSCRGSRARRHDYTDMRNPRPGERPSSGRISVAPRSVVEPLPNDLLERVRECANAEEPDDGIALIYTEVDALLRRGAFPEVDALLGAVDASSLPVVHLLAFVSITCAAK